MAEMPRGALMIIRSPGTFSASDPAESGQFKTARRNCPDNQVAFTHKNGNKKEVVSVTFQQVLPSNRIDS